MDGDATRPLESETDADVPSATNAVGQLVGRYVLLSVLGHGAEGEVFEAFDTELERKVALKLLRGGAPTIAARREARAQAKLDHPAVVSIFDVGDADGRAYIAMELMDPESFETWASGASALDVLSALRRVAGGIEAAHIAGLVHGDIKPSNILRSTRGDAKLSDFGVARPHEGTDVVLAGTRAFMAPELFEGTAAGPSSDQYAFCVTAWQLFHGEHPWARHASRDATLGGSGDAPRDESRDESRDRTGQPLSPLDGPPAWSATGVPRAARDALARGLDPDPARRWPSMQALEAALHVQPTRTAARNRWIALALPAAAVAVTGGLIATSGADNLCADAGAPADEAWTPSHRDAVALALDAAGYTRLQSRALSELDAWAEHWSQESMDSCRATVVEHSQSPDLQDLRGGCYRDALAGFEAVVEVLSVSGEDTLLHAHDVLGGVPNLAPCKDVSALKAEPVIAPELREVADDARADIRRAEVLRRAGQGTGALELLRSLEADLVETGLVRLQMRALVGRADVYATMSDNVAALEDARRALELALTHDDNTVLDDALVLLVGLLGHELSSPAEAEVYATMLEARAERRGIGPGERGAALASLGLHQVGLGHYDKGIAMLQRSLEERAPARGEDVEYAAIMTALAMAQGYAGQTDAAMQTYRRALATRRALVGEEHPLIAHTLHGIAQQQRHQGDFEGALTTVDEALRILESTAPDDHTNLSTNAYNRAQSLAKLGRNGDARTAYEASLRHAKLATPGPTRNVATLQMSLARLYAEEFELFDEAVVLAEAGLRMHIDVLGEEHPDLVITRARYGQVLGRAGRTEEGRTQITRALALGAERLGADHADTIYAQLILAGFELRAESFAAAETAGNVAVVALQGLSTPPEGMLAAAQGIVRDARSAQGLSAD